MKKPTSLLSPLFLAALGFALAPTALAQTAPLPAASEGVRLPRLEPLAPAPGEIAPVVALPDAEGRVVSSSTWLGTHALLVLSVGEPTPEDATELREIKPEEAVPAARVARAPMTAAQVLTARRVAEAVKGAAPRLKARGVAIIVTAGGGTFEALKQAMGTDFKPAAPDTADPPNLFVLREDAGVALGRLASRRLVGRSPSGVSLTAIDRAGFVRLNEGVDDLLSLEPQLVLTGDTTPRIEVGKPAPDFILRDAQGRARRLSSLRGQKNLLLSFFPKCFTGGCANHLSSLSAEKLAFASLNTAVWAASFDPAEGPRGQIAFARQLGLSFPLLPDVGKNLAILYGAALSAEQPAPSRMSVLIDRDGIVRSIDRAVQVRTHGPDTLLKMRELGMQ